MLNLLSQTTLPAPSDLSTWGQYGALVAVLSILGYVLKVVIPKIVDEFRTDSKEQRALFASELANERARSEESAKTWRETLIGLMGEKGK